MVTKKSNGLLLAAEGPPSCTTWMVGARRQIRRKYRARTDLRKKRCGQSKTSTGKKKRKLAVAMTSITQFIDRINEVTPSSSKTMKDSLILSPWKINVQGGH